MPSKLKLYNTLNRKLETFVPGNPSEVKVYTCGPTVYSQPHIGNFAAYVYWDLLVRVLMTNNYTVKRVLNLTDVGHLVSDDDEGEDKMEKGARKSGKSVWEVAEQYIEAFQRDFHKLGLIEPAAWARATDFIEQDKEIVDILRKKGYTYETTDGIYFDTSKFPRYADFAHLDLEGMIAGKRVELSDEKRNPSDFAVWKFIQPGERHAMRWDYLGRPGYPGWHLECSTIIHELLGEPIDIHTGGIDHIPVHHTNEIAQSEAAFDTMLSRFWLHCNFLTVDGHKISKSLGNIYTIDELIEQGYSPFDFKMWVLQGHYRSERDFSLSSLDAARQRRLSWRNKIALSRQQNSDSEVDISGVMTEVQNNLNQDLNSPLALATIDSVGSANSDFWQQVDQLFGLGLIDDSPVINEEQKKLLDQRVAARRDKDYSHSDEIRAQLEAQNIAVLDTPDGQVWQYLK